MVISFVMQKVFSLMLSQHSVAELSGHIHLSADGVLPILADHSRFCLVAISHGSHSFEHGASFHPAAELSVLPPTGLTMLVRINTPSRCLQPMFILAHTPKFLLAHLPGPYCPGTVWKILPFSHNCSGNGDFILWTSLVWPSLITSKVASVPLWANGLTGKRRPFWFILGCWCGFTYP